MNFHVGPDGTSTYTTIDGDTLDLIAFNFYGNHGGTTELLLDANPGLAARGTVYDAGILIRLPERAVENPTVRSQIRLWD